MKNPFRLIAGLGAFFLAGCVQLDLTPEGDPNRPFFEFLGQKYGYTPAGAERSAVLITEILERFAEQLARQQAKTA